MAAVDLAGLLRCLEVTETTPGSWTAPNLPMDYHRIFGGQLLAQTIMLATATAEGRTIRSLGCLFPREGSLAKPFSYEIELSHTGRTFATRRISAEQDGRPFFLAQASLHVPEGGPEHQEPAPDVGDPVDAEPEEMTMIPWETRVVGAVDLRDRAAGPAEYAFWTRVGGVDLDDRPASHQALLAYATDLTVIGTALRPLEGISQADAGEALHTAVTGHSIWFHRPFRIDDWCLISQRAPVVAGARAFGHGNVFDRDGMLVASLAQESMVRPVTA